MKTTLTTLTILAATLAGAETLDITAAALGINSARVPSVSILTADVATVTGGVYANTTDGTRSILDITGGTWSSYNTDGTSSALTFGPIDDTAKTALNSPVTFRISGQDTKIFSTNATANCGTLRFELSDGAYWSNTGALQIAAQQYRKGIATVVLNDATINSLGGFTFGKYENNINRGQCSIYATNATVQSAARSEINCGDFVFDGGRLFVDKWDEYAFSVGEHANIYLCNGADYNAITRLSGNLTIQDGTATISKFFFGTGDSTKTAAVHLVKGTLSCSTQLTPCVGARPAWLDLQGGTLYSRNIRGGDNTKAKKPKGNGFARLTANGTQIVATGNSDKYYPFWVEGWDLVEVGAKGLTLDTVSYDLTWSNNVVNVAGEEGWLRKKGSGTLTWKMPATYSVSKTVVEAGTLLVSPYAADASVTLATALVVTNGAVLSTVGSVADLTVNSLVLTNAVLKMDPTDTITVTGAASVEGLSVVLSSQTTVDTTNHFLTVKGAISADSIKAVKTGISGVSFSSGTYGEVTAKTTADGTVFTLVTKSNASIGGETEWKGPGAAWAEDANWSDKVPVATNTASFADATAPSEVTVASAADVGALSFTAGNFKLTGAGSLNFGAPGSSSVTVSSGAHTVDVAVVQQAVAPVDLAADTSLLFAKSVTGGGFAKTGLGCLTLAGANDFAGTLSVGGGLLAVENTAALTGLGSVSLGDATLELSVPIALPVRTTLKPAASGAAKAVIIKNEEDLTVSSVEMGTGVLLKRGLGKLTIDASCGLCAVLANNNGDHNNGGGCKTGSSVVFADDGTPPTYGYGGFTLLEGEVVVKGTSGTPIQINGAIHVGMNSQAARTSPVLTFDGVKVLAPNMSYASTEVGIKSYANSRANHPTLRVLNGAEFTTQEIILDNEYTGSTRYPTLAVTNATVVSLSGISCSTIRQGGGYGTLAASGGLFKCESLGVSGKTQSRLTGCTLQGYTTDYTKISGDSAAAGTVLFDGGTLLNVNAFGLGAYASNRGSLLVFAFDDATWDVGPDNLTINSSNMHQGTAEYPKPKKFEVRAGGLTIQVASGKTLQTAAEFRGYGPLTLTGGGTLKFDDGAFGLTGTVAVASGTVDFSSVAAVSNNVIRGAGTVSGAAFKEGIVLDPQIASDWTVGAAPTFADCAFANGATVDCSAAVAAGRPTEEVSVVVARYTGTAPDVSAWQLAGTGAKRLRATLTAADGEIRLNVTPRKGVVLFVR